MHTSPPLRLSASRLVLSRRRFKTIAHWMQLMAVTIMSILPVQTSRAIYVPDENSLPVWVPLPGESLTPGVLDETEDQQSGIAWLTNFSDAVSAGDLAFWSGGTFADDGLWQSYGGQWLPATSGVLADVDEDGVPDTVDHYPTDPTNNSFEFEGGTYQLNGIRHAFRAGLYAGSNTDSNSNGLPNVLEDWFINPSNHGTLQHWAGATVIINGESNTFPSCHYFAAAFSDVDGDLLPDEIDPFPSDVWNNTYFTWEGGTFVIEGVVTEFLSAEYPGTGADVDEDGIPDAADPFPQDPSNHGEWWAGGAFVFSAPGVAPATLNVPAQWHATGAGDADNNGIPDDINLTPIINEYLAGIGGGGPTNSFTWPDMLATFVVQNQTLSFEPTEYVGEFLDSDQDGIPELADPFPGDPYNGNDTDGDGLDDAVEALYPGHLDRLVADSGNLRVINGVQEDISYLDIYNYYPGQPLDQPLPMDENTVDDDSDGIPNVWELANGLNPNNAADAASSISGDFLTNLEKFQLGLDPLDFVEEAEAATLGIDWALVAANHNPNLSFGENDWDNDGVSNLDELVLFQTDLRDAQNLPTEEAIIQAIINLQVSATTLMNYQSLVDDDEEEDEDEEEDDEEDEDEEEDDEEDEDDNGNGGGGGMYITEHVRLVHKLAGNEFSGWVPIGVPDQGSVPGIRWQDWMCTYWSKWELIKEWYHIEHYSDGTEVEFLDSSLSLGVVSSPEQTSYTSQMIFWGADSTWHTSDDEYNDPPPNLPPGSVIPLPPSQPL